MKKLLKSTKKSKLIKGYLWGLLTGLPALPAALAVPHPATSQLRAQAPSGILNPKPSIFSEPPYSRTNQPSQSIPATTPLIQPPLPEEQSPPIATVTPMDGMVEVKVKNNTNATVNYEVVGHTPRRILAGKQETELQKLPLPVTITFEREDKGFVKVMPMSATDKQGVLEIALDEDPDLNNSQGAIRIQKNGQVFLN